MLTNIQIQENWNNFLNLIKSGNTPRWEILHSFYTKYEQRFAFMPASGKTSFHSAFPGGHISHTLRVYNTALRLVDLWRDFEAKIDFSEEELMFTALNHDIGKFGTYDAEHFIDQDSNWHRDRGEIYKKNPLEPFMKDFDRSLFLLQNLGIKISENEYLAIKLQSGLYEESNKSYFMAFSEEYKLHSNLPYIIHQSDAMSARIESGNGNQTSVKATKFYNKPKQNVESVPATKVPNSTKSKFSKFLKD